MRKNRLTWFSRVKRREKSKGVRTVMEMDVEKSRGRGKPKKRQLNAIKSNMRTTVVCVDEVRYRVKWRF